MSFHFDINKATEVACRFLESEGGSINIMKLVKLVYLLDRRSVEKRGIPVVGGTYYSLPNGPITMELLDLINAGRLSGAEENRWQELISDRQSHEVAIQAEAPIENLSERELALIDDIHEQFGHLDQWQLRDWTHKQCAEWTPREEGRAEITIQNLTRALGKTDAQIARIVEEAEERRFVRMSVRAR